ncbi:hypothetical protein ARMGADRAFT_1088554 [Armillaria gallica]|uniref:Uncharacterized protein n=1 Tax=Armillaria gallica TaxID=47427 RepID=A0A2H3CSB0_ARMGA|nr:hypothetical protein ARMGADRAFT_1088554 [Armillaria gallica]
MKETEAPPTLIPVIQVEDDPLADIDKSQELHVLMSEHYGLSFDKNIALMANPDDDWWFGTVVTT